MSISDEMKETLRVEVNSAVHEALENRVNSLTESKSSGDDKEYDEECGKKSHMKEEGDDMDKKKKDHDKDSMNEADDKDSDSESDDDDDDDGEDDDDDESDRSEVNEESEAYKKFFRKALDKFGVKSPDELSGKKEKEFYDYVDKNWESDKEESLSESMTVIATKSGSRGNKTETKNISRYSQLVKMARSGDYEYFTVRKRNGDETDYSVDRSGRLVEM